MLLTKWHFLILNFIFSSLHLFRRRQIWPKHRTQNVKRKTQTPTPKPRPFSFVEIQSPYNTEGTRGGQSRVSLMFCSDPPPNNVYWRFGSIQLDALK